MARFDLTDFEWSVIQPLLPSKPRGVPRVDDHRVLNGIFCRLRTGAPWADIPERYGPHTTCVNRFNRSRRSSRDRGARCYGQRTTASFAFGHGLAIEAARTSVDCQIPNSLGPHIRAAILRRKSTITSRFALRGVRNSADLQIDAPSHGRAQDGEERSFMPCLGFHRIGRRFPRAGRQLCLGGGRLHQGVQSRPAQRQPLVLSHRSCDQPQVLVSDEGDDRASDAADAAQIAAIGPGKNFARTRGTINRRTDRATWQT